MQKHQSTEMWTAGHVCKSALSADTCHPQWIVLPRTDAVEEGRLIIDRLFALGVVLRGVSTKHEPCGIVGNDDSGPLFVTAAVKGISGEGVDAGLVNQVELDMTEE